MKLKFRTDDGKIWDSQEFYLSNIDDSCMFRIFRVTENRHTVQFIISNKIVSQSPYEYKSLKDAKKACENYLTSLKTM